MITLFGKLASQQKRYIVAAMLLSVSACVNAVEQTVLKAVTHEDAFPYNYKLNNHITGLVYDIADHLAKRTGYSLEVRTLPWTRALQTARDNSSIMIFSLARNAERENDYYWIGPVASSEVWLFKLKQRSDIQLTSLNDIRNYTIGDIASSSTIALLNQYGAKIDTAPSNLSNCRKFKAGRVDLVPFDPNGVKVFVSACGLQMDQIEKTLHLPRDTALYLALGKSTPKKLVDQLNAELLLMHKDKTLQQIHKQWQIEYKPLSL